MKNTIIFSVLVLIFATTSCSNDDNNSQNSNLEGQGQSLLAFYAFGDIGCGEITVIVDRLETKTMNGQDRPIGFVDCQDTSPSVVQWVDIPEGTYTYIATCNGYTWTGTRDLGLGSCSFLALTAGSAD